MAVRKEQNKAAAQKLLKKKSIQGSIPGDCPGSSAVLSAKLDQLIEFARGDQLLRQYSKWHDIQGPVMKKQLDQLLTLPRPVGDMSEALMRKDHAGLANGMGIKNPNAAIVKDMMVTQRSAQAKAILADRKSGIYKKSFKNMKGLLKARGISLSVKLDHLIELGTDPRPRNALGEYTQQQEGVADPNSMAKTYGSPVARSLSLGGAAALGGAGGAIGSNAVKGAGQALKHVYDRIKASKIRA